MALAIAAETGWGILQLDVKTAFLNDEEVYVKMDPGFDTTAEEGITLVIKLLEEPL